MKITLKEFFESKDILAIHCDTEKKANKLLKEFDKLGKRWSTGTGYFERNNFDIYVDKTCYTNGGAFCEIEFFKNHSYKLYLFEDIIFKEDKPENLIPEVAKLLRVEIGEEFMIKGWSSYKHRFTNKQLEIYLNEWEEVDNGTYGYVFLNNIAIEKLPKKPQLTEAERVILQNLQKKYKWIARDADDDLFIYAEKPTKNSFMYRVQETYTDISAFKHLFQFIKWDDEEPYNIEDLLKRRKKW